MALSQLRSILLLLCFCLCDGDGYVSSSCACVVKRPQDEFFPFSQSKVRWQGHPVWQDTKSPEAAPPPKLALNYVNFCCSKQPEFNSQGKSHSHFTFCSLEICTGRKPKVCFLSHVVPCYNCPTGQCLEIKMKIRFCRGSKYIACVLKLMFSK